MRKHNHLDQGEVKKLFEQQIMRVTARTIKGIGGN